jgi:hypothetical protein
MLLQKKSKLVSIIIPTIKPLHKLNKLFCSIKRSLTKLNCQNSYEIIIISQSKFIDFRNEFLLDIKIIKVNFKNLSRAKNLGIKLSVGQKLCFLDDDIEISHNYIFNVLRTNKDLLFGSIKILNTSQYYNKRMNDIQTKINFNNYNLCLASAMVMKNKFFKIFFDENFGIGSKYPSSEESDLIIQFLKKNKAVYYYPNIVIYHPNDLSNLTLKEIYKKFLNYGFGHISFLKKNKLYINQLKFFILNIVLLFILIFNLNNFSKRIGLLSGLLKSFFYEKK